MRWHIPEALAAWALPGAGHFIAGERTRGVILFIVISSLWLSGLLVGGVTVIDHQENTAWFAAQSLVGPSIVADVFFQRLRSSNPPALPGQSPAYEPSFGRVNELGILFAGLAGLLNTLAIIDMLYHDPNRRPSERKKRAVTSDKP